MSNNNESLKLYLKSFRLPAMYEQLDTTIAIAERDNWTYQAFLETLFEHESNQRQQRKLQSLLKRSQLPEGKTLATLNEDFLPLHVRRLLPSLLEPESVKENA